MPTCPKCGFIQQVKGRSKNQNDLYWGYIVTPFADYLNERGYDSDDVHELLKQECNYKIVYDPDGKGNMIERKIARSTTILSTTEYNEFIKRCLKYASGEGCALSMPDDPKDE